VAIALKYRYFSQGDWSFAVRPERWNDGLHRRVLKLVEGQTPSKHPQTLKLRYPDPKDGDVMYVKVFHRSQGSAGLKDLFRRSKAFRFLRQSVALEQAGFDVPTIIAAGEARRFRFLSRAFTVTSEIQGHPVPDFLQNWILANSGRLTWADKRDSIKHLAKQLRRFHRLGFVHGDLVPSNILVADTGEVALRFYFMDNDRTRRYPYGLPQTLWKRNLVQLNRFPLPGISLQDRVRFFRCYLGHRELRAADYRLLRWLEVKTRERRSECDAVDATIDFRKLMRWQEKTVTGV
jgi:hypothetical protein